VTVRPSSRWTVVVTAAVLSRAPGDAAWANADGGVIAPTIPIVAVGAIPPDLNIDALRHLELLGLDRIGGRRSRQHRCGCRHGEKRCNDTNGSTFSPAAVMFLQHIRWRTHRAGNETAARAFSM